MRKTSHAPLLYVDAANIDVFCCIVYGAEKDRGKTQKRPKLDQFRFGKFDETLATRAGGEVIDAKAEFRNIFAAAPLPLKYRKCHNSCIMQRQFSPSDHMPNEYELNIASSQVEIGGLRFVFAVVYPCQGGTFAQQASSVLKAVKRFSETDKAAIVDLSVFLADFADRSEFRRLAGDCSLDLPPSVAYPELFRIEGILGPPSASKWLVNNHFDCNSEAQDGFAD